jgi:hypothetical protein
MKFILTKELGRLARWMRILGFDTIYFKSDNIGTLIVEALRDKRIIITRRKQKIEGLEKQMIVIKGTELKEQLKEVVKKLNLKVEEEKMFTRCTICNQILEEVEKEEIKDLVPEYVYNTQEFFMKCGQCKRIYWQGSHWGNVKEVIAKLLNC